MNEPYCLVCALADEPTTVAGSIFSLRCGTCGARVMTAPSGQRLLKRFPRLPILCLRCYGRIDFPHAREFAAPLDEIAREKASEMPNFWRRRQ